MVTELQLKRRMRLQAYFLGVLAVISAVLGIVFVALGGLPDKRFLRTGEKVPGVAVPDDFEITVFAMDLSAPRYMAVQPETNVLFVSDRGAGRVVALPDEDGDHVADKKITVLDGLAVPTGLAFHNGWLYLAEASQVSRVRLDEKYEVVEKQIIIDDLPAGRNQDEEISNMYALLIHDNELYVTVEASCAGCDETDSRRAAVLVYALDGSNERTFASGLYYPTALAVNPVNQQIWVAVQGRPGFSQDVPESLYAVQNGDFAGWPACHAGILADPNFAGGCESVLQPLVTLDPQGNISGLAFYANPDAPEKYQGDVFVTLHGGVNKAGKQVGLGLLRLDVDPATGELVSDDFEYFGEGWWLSEEPGDLRGRPWGVIMSDDGNLYVSDDDAGAIYQIRLKN